MPWHVHLPDFAKGDLERLLCCFCLFWFLPIILFCFVLLLWLRECLKDFFVLFLYLFFLLLISFTLESQTSTLTLKNISGYLGAQHNHTSLARDKTDVKTLLSCLFSSLSSQHCWCNWALGCDGVILLCIAVLQRVALAQKGGDSWLKRKEGEQFSPKILNFLSLFFKMSLNLRVNNKC